jgi:hypothetical protein
MPTRRPPPDNVEETALLEWSSIDTDPRNDRRRPTSPVTERAIANVGDGLHLSALPNAWVSEFEDSVVDGADVYEHAERDDDNDDDASAPTTIMQLPPDMYGRRGDASDAHDLTVERDAVDLLKWRAGPPGAPSPPPNRPSGAADPAHGTQSDERGGHRRAAIPLDPQPGDLLDVDPMDEVTLGGLAIDTAERLRTTLDETMRALMAAQAVADERELPEAVVQQLARAVHLLSLAQDLSDEV